MRRSSLVSIGALVLLSGVAAHAWACTCVPPTDFYAAFAGSRAVFVGEVLEISSPVPERPFEVSVTIRVETAWKGVPASTTIQVLTAPDGAACGYSFRVGTRYLVYASRSDGSTGSGELWVSLCSRTHESWLGDPDLDLLKSPMPFMSLSVIPNPIVNWSRIAWTIVGDPELQAHARLEVFDFQGRRIRSLLNGLAAAGPHQSFWDGRDEHGDPVPRGIYWLRLAYGDRVTGRTLVKIATQP